MYEIAKLKIEDRKTLFYVIIKNTKINGEIIEKDFWVTLMLDYLFNRCEYQDYFVFKGGTCLSKCYNLIERFSEDIDLILRWDLLTNDDPNNERSKRQQDLYNKKINSLSNDFIANVLLPLFNKDFKKLLNIKEDLFKIDDDEPGIIVFNYPKVFNDYSTGILNYIKLEFGPLAALIPTQYVNIQPILFKLSGNAADFKCTQVLTTSPERTFWEKVLILHKEAHRPMDRKMPTRYSRHYYDLYKLSKTIFKEKAYKAIYLLKEVRDFDSKFYPYSWAKCELAVPGTIKLLPPDYRLDELRIDFEKTKNMIYDKSIEQFNDLLPGLQALENELNNL